MNRIYRVSSLAFMLLCLGCARVFAQAGPVLCWGDNPYGQIGNDSAANVSVATPAFYLSGIKAIAAASDHRVKNIESANDRQHGGVERSIAVVADRMREHADTSSESRF